MSKEWFVKLVSAFAAIAMVIFCTSCGQEAPSKPAAAGGGGTPSRIAAAGPAARPPDRQPLPEFSPGPAPPDSQQPGLPETAATPQRKGPRTLADLVQQEDASTGGQAATVNPPPANAAGGDASWTLDIDDTRAAVAGIRKLQSRHLTLYTDVPQQPAVDELPAVFDLAVPQWCAYFGIPPRQADGWQITGFLMDQKARFQGTGLMPADLPPFPNGYQRGSCVWVYNQPTDFYRRHLLLHEGTHAFMDRFLGGLGPPWYAEGMAELLGTHRWFDSRLTLGYSPRDKTESEGWGRVKIIRDELAGGRGMMPENILNYGPQAHLTNEPYGWCWGLCTFLDGHPLTQQVFRRLPEHVRGTQLTQWFRQQLAQDWTAINEDWQIFVMDLDYGYDVARAAITRKLGVPLDPGGASAQVVADRGWQSTGVRVEAGSRYELLAAGRYQIRETTQPWWCEPGGVTIEYYRGFPLGMLMTAVRDDAQPLAGLSPLTRPQPAGLRTMLVPDRTGTLYVKINESPAGLADNVGQLTVQIRNASGQ